MDYALATLLGIALGTGFIWLTMRAKVQVATKDIQHQLSASQAIFQERLNGKDQLLAASIEA